MDVEMTSCLDKFARTLFPSLVTRELREGGMAPPDVITLPICPMLKWKGFTSCSLGGIETALRRCKRQTERQSRHLAAFP
eukprot:5625519-Pleurochrysis_carterae.AAC.1